MNGKNENIKTTPPIFKGETNRSAYCGYTCVGGRTEDQDCLAYDGSNGRQMFAVCDGMGGHAGGCVASEMAARTLVTSLRRQVDIVSIQDAMQTAVNEANSSVFQKSQEEPSLRGMGTTLTLLVIDADAAYATHIGDSRIYQLRKGRKVFRTFDHSMVFQQVAQGKMSEEEARVHPRSNQLSSAIGVMPDVDVYVQKLEYKKGDRFILCCDGVWNSLPETDIISLFTANTDVEATVLTTRTTVEKIGMESGGGHDNHTMICVDMKQDSKYRKSVFTRFKELFVSKSNG